MIFKCFEPVYPNRGIKCGRCSSDDDAGVVSLFDLVASEGLFRCVNRYEGCNKLLNYPEVADHEKYCKGGYYDCPLCVDFHGSAYDILQHYQAKHSNKFLESPEFLVELENESYEVYLYKKKDFLFFVNVKFSISDDELTVMIEYIGAKLNAKKIVHSMTVHSLEGPAKKKTKKNICSGVAEQEPGMLKFNLKPDDFPKKIAICRFEINTEAVESMVELPERKFSFGNGVPPDFPFGEKKSTGTKNQGILKQPLFRLPTLIPQNDPLGSNSTIPISNSIPSATVGSSGLVNSSSNLHLNNFFSTTLTTNESSVFKPLTSLTATLPAPPIFSVNNTVPASNDKPATSPNPFRVVKKPLKPQFSASPSVFGSRSSNNS